MLWYGGNGPETVTDVTLPVNPFLQLTHNVSLHGYLTQANTSVNMSNAKYRYPMMWVYIQQEYYED